MQDFFSYLSELSQEDLTAVAEKVIAQTLSAKFGCPVYASIQQNDGKSVVEMWGNRHAGIDVVQFDIRPTDLKPKVIRQIFNRTRRALERKMAMDEYLRLKEGTGRNVTGNIFRINQVTGEILIHIQEGHMKEWYGSYPLIEQPVHERKRYQVGQELELYVLGAAIISNGSTQVRITLSRRAHRFVEQMLYRLLFEGGHDLSRQRIRCIKRVAGHFSIVSATVNIPRAIVVEAVKLAGEKIYVSVNGTEIRAIKRRGHV